MPPNKYEEIARGWHIDNTYGIVKAHITDGEPVTLKVMPHHAHGHTEAEMTHFASQRKGILAAQVHGCYKVESETTTIVMKNIAGDRLSTVWKRLNAKTKASIKAQLKAQIQAWREYTQPYVGRMNNERLPNFFAHPSDFAFMGPFSTEEEFDKYCMGRFRWPVTRYIWKHLLPGTRRNSGKFVLTHGNLSARNIIVQNGKITAIVNWSYSGLMPEYMEYVMGAVVKDEIEDWWLPQLREVLKEVLGPCTMKRRSFSWEIKSRKAAPGIDF